MNMEILEGNKLIAEFMGVTPIKWVQDEDRPTLRSGRDNMIEVEREPEEMEYHSSWDWLMPVVEKIEKHCDIVTGKGEKNRYNVVESIKTEWTRSYPHYTHRTVISICTKINGFESEVYQIEFDSKNKIESVYTSVVEFIKWYNLNQPTH